MNAERLPWLTAGIAIGVAIAALTRLVTPPRPDDRLATARAALTAGEPVRAAAHLAALCELADVGPVRIEIERLRREIAGVDPCRGRRPQPGPGPAASLTAPATASPEAAIPAIVELEPTPAATLPWRRIEPAERPRPGLRRASPTPAAAVVARPPRRASPTPARPTVTPAAAVAATPAARASLLPRRAWDEERVRAERRARRRLAVVCEAARRGDHERAVRELDAAEAEASSSAGWSALSGAVLFNASRAAVVEGRCRDGRRLAARAAQHDDPWASMPNLTWWRTLMLVRDCADFNLTASLKVIRPKVLPPEVCTTVQPSAKPRLVGPRGAGL